MSESAPPIVTFTTDFGVADAYVGAMKGALLRHCPRAVMVDITHAIPRHDLLAGAIALERAIAAFPQGAIHVAVVDPGVGTDRRLLIARWGDQTAICPDNGLLTWAWRRRGPGELFEIAWRPAKVSPVFHGRDLLAPVAGMLAAGTPIEAIARPIDDPVLLDFVLATDLQAGGVVIHVDHFGNATTNVPAELLEESSIQSRKARPLTVIANGRPVGPLRRTYQDVPAGEPLALIGSSHLLEIAVREGSASEMFGLKVGDRVEFG